MLRFAVFLFLIASSLGGFCQSVPLPEDKQAPTAASPTANVAEPVSTEVAEAEAAIAKTDWKTAEAKLELWLAGHANDARALFDAAYVADAQSRLQDAEGLYLRAVVANPQSFEAHLSLGLLLARENKREEAHPYLEKATTLDPGLAEPAVKARAWRALAEIDRNDNPIEASNDLLEALKLTPETTTDTLLAANLAELAGNSDAAEKAYRRILVKEPKSAAANAGLAHLLIARKDFPAAESFLRTALEQTPDDLALTAQLATVLASEDNPEALPLIEKLHEAHPNDGAVTRMLAHVLAEAGDAAGSDHLFVGLLGATPNDPELLIGHGQNLIRQLKYPDAFAAFDKATRLAPANADGWSGLAFAASRTNQPAVTLHALTMRSRYLPEVPSTYFLWATAYDTLHDKSSAATYYHRFLDSSAGKFPDQEWQARQRLLLLEKKP